ncbi:MAG: GldG family protein [Chloroflexi bacterium]|nr:GldG family protein [Chloroflexota bacterium]
MAKKTNKTARYAPVGMVITLLASIATFLLILVKGAVAIKAYTPDPAQTNIINIGLIVSILAIVLGLAIYAILAPEKATRFITGRQARYGSNTLIMSLAFLGILLVANTLAIKNPVKPLDMTEDKQNTLAPETIQALATLPEKVTALAFYTQQNPTDTARQLLSNLKSDSNGKFDFKFVDPNTDPVSARQYSVTRDGTIVLTMGDKKEIAASASESDLVNSMIRLISPEQRTVYFITGHGEPDINATDNKGYARARQTLESKNYTVKTLNLAAENKIPADAKVIVIAGSLNPLLDQEVSLLKAYVNKGGSLVILETPTLFTNAGTNPDPLINYLTSDWGITLNNDLVIDNTSNQPIYAISASYNNTHPITQRLTAVTVMPQARSLSLNKTAPQNVTLTGLILTSQQAWGETDLAGIKNNNQPGFDAATDFAGPLTLAASGENATTSGRVVVFGNSIFATDQGFDAYANGDIFTNSVDWAAKQANLVNITARQAITRTFNLPSQGQVLIILLLSVIIIPGLVIAAGISTWVARRRQG